LQCPDVESHGPSGLPDRQRRVDTFEESNFLASVQTQVDDVYALIGSNFTSFQGFTLQFSEEVSFKSSWDMPIPVTDLEGVNNVYSQGSLGSVGEEIVSSANGEISDYNIHLYPNTASNKLFVKSSGIVLTSLKFRRLKI
jgi:hypothetical protein